MVATSHLLSFQSHFSSSLKRTLTVWKRNGVPLAEPLRVCTGLCCAVTIDNKLPGVQLEISSFSSILEDIIQIILASVVEKDFVISITCIFAELCLFFLIAFGIIFSNDLDVLK